MSLWSRIVKKREPKVTESTLLLLEASRVGREAAHNRSPEISDLADQLRELRRTNHFAPRLQFNIQRSPGNV